MRRYSIPSMLHIVGAFGAGAAFLYFAALVVPGHIVLQSSLAFVGVLLVSTAVHLAYFAE